MRIERPKENFVAQNSEPAIDTSAARPNVRGKRALVLPNRSSGFGIERKRTIILSRCIQNSVHDERRSFKFSARHRLVSPLGNQRARIRRVDLAECAEAMPRVVPRIHKPVLWLLCGIKKPLRRYLRLQARCDKVRD